MPIYRFEFQEEKHTDTVRDVELVDDVAAMREADQTAFELLEEGVRLGLDRSHWQIQVFDEEDKLVSAVTLADALKQRQIELPKE